MEEHMDIKKISKLYIFVMIKIKFKVIDLL